MFVCLLSILVTFSVCIQVRCTSWLIALYQSCTVLVCLLYRSSIWLQCLNVCLVSWMHGVTLFASYYGCTVFVCLLCTPIIWLQCIFALHHGYAMFVRLLSIMVAQWLHVRFMSWLCSVRLLALNHSYTVVVCSLYVTVV